MKWVWRGCRFNLLRELIPNKEKLDKAAFLTSTMEYIQQLQVSLLLKYVGYNYTLIPYICTTGPTHAAVACEAVAAH